MKASTGYYCLIQYCPDLGRLEAANVGVLLFCPEPSFLAAKTVPKNARIKKFFGSQGHDWERINSFKRGIEQRLKNEAGEIRTLDDLKQFIALQANLIQITPPRPMSVTNPQTDLEALFREMLGEPVHRTTRQSFQREVQEKLFKAGLERKLRTDIHLEVPILHKEVRVPFGYQNGHFNLLATVPFEAKDPDQSLTTACKYAVEGQSLNETKHPEFGDLQFCVVGKFRPKDQETPERVKNLLDHYGVKLYRSDDMSTLIKEIKTTGKDVVPQ